MREMKQGLLCKETIEVVRQSLIWLNFTWTCLT